MVEYQNTKQLGHGCCYFLHYILKTAPNSVKPLIAVNCAGVAASGAPNQSGKSTQPNQRARKVLAEVKSS